LGCLGPKNTALARLAVTAVARARNSFGISECTAKRPGTWMVLSEPIWAHQQNWSQGSLRESFAWEAISFW